jgi:hypothetical protein
MEYSELMGTIENEFFLAKLKQEIKEVDDVELLRKMVLEVVSLMQRQRELFLSGFMSTDMDL